MHVDVAIAKMPLEARGAGILLRLIRAALLIHGSCGHFAGEGWPGVQICFSRLRGDLRDVSLHTRFQVPSHEFNHTT
jgi:hypothetical protein